METRHSVGIHFPNCRWQTIHTYSLAKEKPDLMTWGKIENDQVKMQKERIHLFFFYQHWNILHRRPFPFYHYFARYFLILFASNDEFKSSAILSMLQFLVFISFSMCIFNIVLVEYMHFFIISFTSFAMKNKCATQQKPIHTQYSTEIITHHTKYPILLNLKSKQSNLKFQIRIVFTIVIISKEIYN